MKKIALALAFVIGSTGVPAAEDSPEVATLFTKTRAECTKVKNYPAWQSEVVKNYRTLDPDTVDQYLPGKVQGDNAAYLFVNPKAWADLSPKLQLTLTDAAYMVEVCNPKTTKFPTLVIADWKSKRPIGTRRIGDIGGWFGN